MEVPSTHDRTDLGSEVDLLKRRLDEQDALLRRTHAAVTSLADSLGKLVTAQRRRERGINLNSFIAYTLFTLLLGGGFFMLYSTRAGDIIDARDEAVADRDGARERAASLQIQLGEREAAERAAYEFYLLLRDRSGEAVARFPEIEQQRLSETERALFSDGIARARIEIVDAGFVRGIDAFRAGDLATAQTALQSALAYEDEGPRAAQMRYYLGRALTDAGDHDSAVRQLELALAGQAERSGLVDVRYHLAAALEQVGEHERARSEYEKFASANPKDVKAITARRRAVQLVHQSGRVRTN